MVYAEQIESKIREIRQEGNSPRLDDSSTKRLRRGFITKILLLNKSTRVQTKIPKVVAILLRGLGTLLVGSNIWVGVLTEHINVLHVVIRVTR